jgi:hypothetical protein
MYMHIRPIPNGLRDGAISLYSSKIVDKKEILRTVSNTDIYCSSDKVVTATRVRTWRVARLYSVGCTVQ